MSIWVTIWLTGFLLMSTPAVINNTLAQDPDDQFKPVIIFLYAAWPLLLAFFVLFLVLTLISLVPLKIEEIWLNRGK